MTEVLFFLAGSTFGAFGVAFLGALSVVLEAKAKGGERRAD